MTYQERDPLYQLLVLRILDLPYASTTGEVSVQAKRRHALQERRGDHLYVLVLL